MLVRATVIAATIAGMSGLALPASASPSWLTIRAERSAVTTVTIPRPMTLLLAEPGDPGPVLAISGGGAVAGFLLTPRSGSNDSVGQIALTAPGLTRRYSMGEERQVVPAGAYTLRVVAESSPVVIRVPTLGLTAAWTARQPLRTHRGTATWDTPAGPLLLGGTGVTLGPSSVVLLAASYETSGVGGEAVVCLTTPDGMCNADEGAWSAQATTVRTGPAVRTAGGFATFAERVARGTFTARWRITTYGASITPSAVAVVIG